jgi:hypothetical protein
MCYWYHKLFQTTERENQQYRQISRISPVYAKFFLEHLMRRQSNENVQGLIHPKAPDDVNSKEKKPGDNRRVRREG